MKNHNKSIEELSQPQQEMIEQGMSWQGIGKEDEGKQ